MEEKIMNKIEKMIPEFVKIAKPLWVDYDKEADVLYISFEKPQNAEDSLMEGNVIIHKRGNNVVGLTILNASKFEA
ncbi:DUF2283 domain-containing protein [Candidatus Pacearchaeota archaeon]|nr:DUF2283 domain-containing protein [Candidatus Pacearchaeota archaeon]